jgi:hypothetical protein
MQTSSTSGFARRCTARALLAVASLAAAGLPFLTATGSAAAQQSDPSSAIVSLCSVSFEPASRPPARISPQGRACLDDVTLNLQKRPETKIALIGNAKSPERSGAAVAARRAAVVKKYLVREKGVEVTRITLYTGHQDAAVVAINLLPPGREMDATLVVPVDEARLR